MNYLQSISSSYKDLSEMHNIFDQIQHLQSLSLSSLLSRRAADTWPAIIRMGSDDDYQRKPKQQKCSIMPKLKITLLLFSTNLLSIYLFSGSSASAGAEGHFFLWGSSALLRELNATRSKLAANEAQLDELQPRLSAATSLLEDLLSELGRTYESRSGGDGSSDGWPEDLSGELKVAVGPHKLPLGFTSNIGSDDLYPTMGVGCRVFHEELAQYMSYEVGKECPSDDVFAQRLMLKGCEPLPRRRCHPKSPEGYVEPTPFPESLWTIPPDTSIVWDPYTCKNYSCLVNRTKAKGSYDCKDCFNLAGRERSRWLFDNGNLDFSIANVLRTKPPGTIRIGLDIGGGTGTFAARMRERNVTIVTTTMNFDGPFNSFIAARGLVALQMSVVHRLPFYEGTLDIVHSMHVLSNWLPEVVLEAALYDVRRVLRPGGLFWLDRFFCIGEQLNRTYAPMIDRVGFNRLRWSVGRKLDRGIEKEEWYLSALLEKPVT